MIAMLRRKQQPEPAKHVIPIDGLVTVSTWSTEHDISQIEFRVLTPIVGEVGEVVTLAISEVERRVIDR